MCSTIKSAKVDKTEFITQLFTHGAIKFGEFKLKSGKYITLSSILLLTDFDET